VTALDEHRPDALNAYPSILALLAEEKLAGRLHASPRVLCTSSEQRTRDVTARIELAFGVRPHDCYALTETGITALDCSEHTGLHVFEDLSIVEIVDARGEPAAPGEVGARALVTNLYNRALPMIRVEVSDLLVALPGTCACGRAFRRLAAVEGRGDDVLTLRGLDGSPRRVHPIRLRTKLAACADVVQYRASFEGSALLVEVVLAHGTSAADATRSITDALAAFVRDQALAPLSLEVRALDRVPREPGGKLKVVRQLAASP
jgi:phenylacetate-coenzyme A ligase PaaK-like adenylate-forming protein